MRCFAITRPDFFEGEVEAIEALLDSGVIERVHIRKPQADSAAIERLLSSVRPDLRPRLSLHDAHFLALRYGTGVHLNSRNPLPPEGFDGIVSRSCHSFAECALPCDYRFLSPIFDSISKAGYSSGFDLDSLRGKVDGSFVALGGVTPERLPALVAAGFGGAAFLGYIWQGNLTENLKNIERYRLCCNS